MNDINILWIDQDDRLYRRFKKYCDECAGELSVTIYPFSDYGNVDIRSKVYNIIVVADGLFNKDLSFFKSMDVNIPILIVCDCYSSAVALEYIKQGAHDVFDGQSVTDESLLHGIHCALLRSEREAETKNNERILFEFLEAMPIGVFVLNTEGHPYFANDKAKEILGKGIMPDINNNELATTYNAYLPGSNTLYPIDQMPIINALQGRYTHVENMEIHQHDKVIPIEVWGSPIYTNDNKSISFAIAAFADITTRKNNEKEKDELQRQLIESEKLSAVGLLAAGVAHEFNNILAVIKSATELILLINDLSKLELPENIIKEVTSIDNNTNKAAEIVANLMAIAKPKVLKKELHSIEEILDEIIVVQAKQCELEHITIIKQYGNIPQILLDKGQIQQVLLNLIINARHAINEIGKGSITITTTQKESQVEIRIKDTGCGIDDDVKERIFTPFFSTKGGYSKNALNIKGTGLGLSVSHKIIHNHNGTIFFNSIKSKGTEFIIRLPITQKYACEELPEKKGTYNFKEVRFDNVNILVIDDEVNIVNCIKDIFETLGSNDVALLHEKYVAADIVTGNYDIIFLDLMMPEISGEDIYKEIRSTNSSVYVVAMSGNSEMLDDFSGKYIGDKRLMVLNKPFSIEELVDRVNSLLP